VSITSSDSAATDSTGTALPVSKPLAQGTATFDILFGTAGSQTATASYTSATTVTANTGSATTVNP